MMKPANLFAKEQIFLVNIAELVKPMSAVN